MRTGGARAPGDVGAALEKPRQSGPAVSNAGVAANPVDVANRGGKTGLATT